MKKLLLALSIVSVIFLSGCSVQKTVTFRDTTINDLAQAGKDFAASNGFKVIYSDEARHIYNINCYEANENTPWFFSTSAEPAYKRQAGFIVRLKQNGDDVDMVIRSYGLLFDGFIFNKSGRMINFLKQEGFDTKGLIFTHL